MKTGPRILIVPGWLDSTNVYAEYIQRYASKDFYIEKNYYENIDPDNFDLFFPLYASIKTPPQIPQHKIVKIMYEGHEGYGVHPDNPVVGACTPKMVKFCQSWLDRPKENVFNLKFGIDTAIFKPFPMQRKDNDFNIGFVGGLENPRKMYKELIEPLKDIPGVKLLTSDLQNQMGEIRNWFGMPNFYNQLDLLVHASKFEGFCFPFVEAAACGVPIVSTNVGVIRDFEKAGGAKVINMRLRGGHMEKPDEVRDQLRDWVVYLRDHKNELKQMSKAQRSFAESYYTWDKRIVNFIKFFQKGLRYGS
jgi:glycosyltransferase involved in cell wall biosynthesis